jgi:hypothetical protein
VPAALPAYLPDDWKGGFVLLVLVFVLSSFLDNIAAAMIGGAVAHTVFRGKVHIGYLAAIVAASNGGGAGSVVGDTTTTMMWIAGVHPLEVLEGFIGSGVALILFGIPAALTQQRHSPIVKDPDPGTRIDPVRVAIVAFVLIAAIVVNIAINTRFAEISDRFPFLGRGGLSSDPGLHRAARARLGVAARRLQGLGLPPLAGAVRLDDAGREAARRVVADRARPGLPVCRVRQHPAHRPGAQAGRLRLGLPGVRGRLRRLDDLVRLLGGRGADEHVSRGRSVGKWLRHGWTIALAYVVGFLVMLATIGFHPGSVLKGSVAG